MAPRFAAVSLLAAMPQLASSFGFGDLSSSLSSRMEEATCLKDVGSAAATMASCMKDGSSTSDCDACLGKFYETTGSCASKHSSSKTMVQGAASQKDACVKAMGMKAEVECVKTVGLKAKEMGSCVTSGDCSGCLGKFEQETASCASSSATAKSLIDKAKAEQAGCEKIQQMQQKLDGATSGLQEQMKEAQLKAQDAAAQAKEAAGKLPMSVEEAQAQAKETASQFQERASANLAALPQVDALQNKVKEAQAKAQEAADQATAAATKLNVEDIQAEATDAAGQLQQRASAKLGELPQVSALQEKAKEAQLKAQDAATEANEAAKKLTDEYGTQANTLVGNVQAKANEAKLQAQNAAAQAKESASELKEEYTEQASEAVGSFQQRASAQLDAAPQVGALQDKMTEANAQLESTASAMDDFINSASSTAGNTFADANTKAIELSDKLTESVDAMKGSCVSYGCGKFNASHPCHCTDECEGNGNCCADYKPFCLGVAGVVENVSAAAQAAEAQAEAAGEAVEGKVADALGKAEVYKQCAAKSVAHLATAHACIDAKPAAVCECAADFNASMKPCLEHLPGKTIEELPGKSCPKEVLSDIQGAMSFTVSDPESFLADEKAPKAIEDTVANLAGLSDSKYVSAILKPLQGVIGRRLAEGPNVKADYTIAVPKSSALFANVTAAAEKLQESASDAEAVLQSKIKETMGDKYNVSGVLQQIKSPSDQNSFNYMLYIGIFLLVAAILGGVAYLCLNKDAKPEKKKKRAAKQPAAQPAATVAPAPMVHPVAQAVPTFSTPSFTSYTSQAPLLQPFAQATPVPTQAYHMPVYYPATTAAPMQGSPRVIQAQPY